MSAWSILLRVLLTVALILNGSGYAVASSHMQMDHMVGAGGAPAFAEDSAGTAESGCSEHHRSTVPVAGNAGADAVVDAASAKSSAPSPDCCKSGACRCVCVQQAQAAVPALALQPALVEHVRSLIPMDSDYASPALPHLIRPPIG